MSYWDHRKPQLRARAVDVGDIARVSAELLDEGGLRALTVRAVAGRLGVAPASLYSRVESVDDLFDLALDAALAGDAAILRAVAGVAEGGDEGSGEGAGEAIVARADLQELMLAYFRHLVGHRWACQVIAMRAPRGPHYLRLSERMCALLEGAGAPDPLGAAYALSNFVIGSATTAPMAGDERATPVDPEAAPRYARLHRDHAVAPEEIVAAGLAALTAHLVG